ncbi:MAG: hypothetical protein JNM18_00100 [Planctomycetaceae bacterium]|nr:hypothetical protein [Planctomycetaceae bacterium]
MSDGTSPLRIAMWSGPRNISTALLRSWENRPDTIVCDEPLYAHYLDGTQRAHPGAAEIIAHHERDWRRVVAWLTGPLPPGKTIFYQKQMAHHLLPIIERDWLDQVTNCFLIREPRRMLVSLDKVFANPELPDTGLPQQVEIFRRVREHTGQVPPVIDAADVLADPRGVLSRLCAALGVEFCDAMLRWPPGIRSTDGIWARHWYAEVEKSTGFHAPPPPDDRPIPPHLERLVDDCQRLYEELAAHKITV